MYVTKSNRRYLEKKDFKFVKRYIYGVQKDVSNKISNKIISNKIKKKDKQTKKFLTLIRAFHIFSSSLFNTPCFTQNNIK